MIYALIETKSDAYSDAIATCGTKEYIEHCFKSMCSAAFDWDEVDEDDEWDEDYDEGEDYDEDEDDEEDDEDDMTDEEWDDFCEDYYGEEYEEAIASTHRKGYDVDTIIFPTDVKNLEDFTEWHGGGRVVFAVIAESFQEFLQKLDKHLMYKVPQDAVESQEFFNLLNEDLSDIYSGCRCKKRILR